MMKKSAIRAMHAKKHHGKVMAYDVKMRQMTEMLNPTQVRLKNGRHALKGTSKWGTKMMKFIAG